MGGYSTVISIGGWEQFVRRRGADCVLAGGVVRAFLYEA